MVRPAGPDRVVSTSREISADSALIFELIADPSQQPRWDGNDNLSQAGVGQRVHAVGDVFTMTLTTGSVRENHVVEFDESRLIAWRPAEVGGEIIGHLWRLGCRPLRGGGSSRRRRGVGVEGLRWHGHAALGALLLGDKGAATVRQ